MSPMRFGKHGHGAAKDEPVVIVIIEPKANTRLELLGSTARAVRHAPHVCCALQFCFVPMDHNQVLTGAWNPML